MSGLVVAFVHDEVYPIGPASKGAVGKRAEDTCIVLGDHAVDDRRVRGVRKRDCILRVVHVQMLRARVFAKHEAVLEALGRHVAEYLVIVLVAARHETDRVTRTRLKLLAKVRVADVLVKAELRLPC